jgi:hypothetical protein
MLDQRLCRRDDVWQEMAKWVILEPSELSTEAKKVLGIGDSASFNASDVDLVSELLQAPNAAASSELYRDLESTALNKNWLADLCLNVARPRTGAPEGRRGVLTRLQAHRIYDVLTQLSPGQTRRLQRLLDETQKPVGAEADPVAERGFILKALAAHFTLGRVDWREIENFARGIRGLPRYALMRTTTLMDIDSRSSTSGLDTVALTQEGAIYDPISLRSARKNNDGLIQSFDASCGPAAAEVVLGEVDPTFSFKVHCQGGPHSLSGTTIAEHLQEAWIRHFDDKPRRRRGAYEYGRLKTLSKGLVETGEMTKGERLALLRYARDPNIELSDLAQKALRAMRQQSSFPKQKTLEIMRRSSPATMGEGTSVQEYRAVLKGLLAEPMGAKFRLFEGEAESLLERVMPSLKRAAGIGGAILGTSDHWWAVMDVAEGPTKTSLLIHDPYTGITAWVTTQELLKGNFSQDHFHWPGAADIDSFFVPVAQAR